MQPMPKPMNENILTKKISNEIHNNFLMPNIENDVEDELRRLGLDTKLLMTSNHTMEKKTIRRKNNACFFNRFLVILSS